MLILVEVDCRLEEATGLAFRFIIGKSKDKAKMLELGKEVARYDDFLLLDIEEEYSKLPYKTLVLKGLCCTFCVFGLLLLRIVSLKCFCYRLAFFKAAYALFDSDFYVKADDDIYLRPGDLISKP